MSPAKFVDACLVESCLTLSLRTMKNYFGLQWTALLALAFCAGQAAAHEGHGPSGSHWHATDVWGLVALGGMVAVAIWLSRDPK